MHLFLEGKSELVLTAIADATFDSCVTDPPYELTSARPGGRSDATKGKVMGGFMGMKWDGSGIAFNVDLWREVYRVLKPGAHLLAFGGTRTYHRMVCAIEDAGFEIRDQIQWIYGSGFPKSLDVSKAIDKMHGVEREVVGIGTVTGARKGSTIDDGNGYTPGRTFQNSEPVQNLITAPATDDAKTWNGWGSALKPANEPIVLARKPLDKGLNIAQNVLRHGTGAINIDGCRVEIDSDDRLQKVGTYGPDRKNGSGMFIKKGKGIYGREGEVSADRRYTDNGSTNFAAKPGPRGGDEKGRFPANVIHDGSPEVLDHFPYQQSGANPTRRGSPKFRNTYSTFEGQEECEPARGAEEGSAARFFYCAKADKSDRNHGLDGMTPKHIRRDDGQPYGMNTNTHRPDGSERKPVPPQQNHHPTVKPTDLMRYLCRLITPPGGLILDPFLGSGSTAKAALMERFRIVGIEMNREYLDIARNRLNEIQISLFG